MTKINFKNTRVPVKHGLVTIHLDRTIEVVAHRLDKMQIQNSQADASKVADVYATLVRNSVCPSFQAWVDPKNPAFKHNVCKSGENNSKLLAGKQCLHCTLMNQDFVRRPEPKFISVESIGKIHYASA